MLDAMARRREPEGTRALGGKPPPGLAVHVLVDGDDELAIFEWSVDAPAALSALTPGEREVLAAIVDGASNAAIARARKVSVRTVANQVSSILHKLGVGSRFELRRSIARGK